MVDFTLRSAMPVSANDLYDWHARPGAFARLNPPWETATVTQQDGSFGTAPFLVTVRTKVLGPVHGRFVSEAFDFQPGVGFRDREIHGPFAEWNHHHRMIPDEENSSFLEDHIDYRLPLGAFGAAFGSGIVHDRLAAMFAYRHFVTASDLRRHKPFANRRRLKIAITGSTGLVGTDLTRFLTTGGHSVVRLASKSFESRQGAIDDGTTTVRWSPREPLDPAILDGVDAVIHLAADNIASGRWRERKKREILESRTIPTQHIAAAIAALPTDRRPRALLSASAVGTYGDRGEEELTEESRGGEGFLADVCRAWEGATRKASEAGTRVIHLRIGVVLTPVGGALGKQLPAFRAGVGAVLGSGKQWVPWITVHDLVGAIHHCLMNESIEGAINLTAPHPVRNREFTKTLGKVLARPAFFWLPKQALELMFGGVADAALLASMRALPGRLLDSSFAFDHTELEPALRFLLGRAQS